MPLVAVLTGQTTGSSGEAVVIAFRGRPNTRSFGEKTSGLPTGIEWFTLSDGAVIGLAMVTFADREGHEYSERIIPDEIVYEDPSGNTDRPLEAATKWILSQPVCTAVPPNNSLERTGIRRLLHKMSIISEQVNAYEGTTPGRSARSR
jgi:C-terminal processing protease CtpA/Prc